MGPQKAYPSSYFKDVDSNPKVLKAILVDFLKKIGYSFFKESFADRIHIGDYSSSADFNVVKAISAIESMTTFPFVIYTIESTSLDEDNVSLWTKAKTSGIYSSLLNRYIYIWPEVSEISLFFFFKTPDDFYVGSNYFILYKFDPIREYFHYFLNFNTSQEYNNLKILYKALIPYTVVISSVEKGEYAFKFREFLERMKIFDLVVRLKLYYHNFSLTQYEEAGEIERIQLNDNKDLIVIESDPLIPFKIIEYGRALDSIYIEFSKSIDFRNFNYVITQGNFKGVIEFENFYKRVRFIGDFVFPFGLVIPSSNKSLDILNVEYLDKAYELRFME